MGGECTDKWEPCGSRACRGSQSPFSVPSSGRKAWAEIVTSYHGSPAQQLRLPNATPCTGLLRHVTLHAHGRTRALTTYARPTDRVLMLAWQAHTCPYAAAWAWQMRHQARGCEQLDWPSSELGLAFRCWKPLLCSWSHLTSRPMARVRGTGPTPCADTLSSCMNPCVMSR